MPEICLRFAWEMLEKCLRYARDMPDICLRYAYNMPYMTYMTEILLRYALDTRYTLKMHLTYTRDTEIGQSYGWDMPKICVRNAWYMPEICQR